MTSMMTRQPVLTDFQQAGVLGLADVHTAVALCRLAGESDHRVLLAAALAVAALRRGSVCLELNRFREAAVDVEGVDAQLAAQLEWPEDADLLAALQPVRW